MEILAEENIAQIVARLSSATLTPRQKSVVKKFRKNPRSRDFLPLYYLLVELGYGTTAINFLYSRLLEHPGFSAARLVLAEALVEQGNTNLASEIIDTSPVDERSNKSLQKLRLFLAFLSHDHESIRRILAELSQRKLLDPEITKVQDAFILYGAEQAREETVIILNSRFPSVRFSEISQFHQIKITQEDLPRMNRQGPEVKDFTTGSADDFRVVAIDEVIPLRGLGGHTQSSAAHEELSLNIDSTTLAEIYEKQGLFKKALAIYRRLLISMPRNQGLRKKVEELAELEKKQELSDPRIASEVAQKVESLHNIDRNISFFEDLLARLKGS